MRFEGNPISLDAILDVGYGDCTLTAKIAAYAKLVVGVDASNNLILVF